MLPIAATVVIVVKAGKLAVDTATPLAEKLPFPKGQAVLAVYVIGAMALALVSFAAGVFARSVSTKVNTVSFLEDRIFNRFPPYVAIRKQTERLAGMEADENLKPALVLVDNGWRIGFLIDAFDDGHVAVFLPGAPDPSSGAVQIISSDNITPINVSHRDTPRMPRALRTRPSKSSGKVIFEQLKLDLYAKALLSTLAAIADNGAGPAQE